MNVQTLSFKDKGKEKDSIQPDPPSPSPSKGSRVSSIFRKKPKKVKAATSLIQDPGPSHESKKRFSWFRLKPKEDKQKQRSNSVGHDTVRSKDSERRHSSPFLRPRETSGPGYRSTVQHDDVRILAACDAMDDVRISADDINTSAVPGDETNDPRTDISKHNNLRDETSNCRYKETFTKGFSYSEAESYGGTQCSLAFRDVM